MKLRTAVMVVIVVFTTVFAIACSDYNNGEHVVGLGLDSSVKKMAYTAYKKENPKHMTIDVNITWSEPDVDEDEWEYDYDDTGLLEYEGEVQLKNTSSFLYSAYENNVETTDVVNEYYRNLNINIPKASDLLRSNVFTKKDISLINTYDIVVFKYDGINYKGLYIGNGFMLTNRGYNTLNVDTVMDYDVKAIIQAVEKIDVEKFIKMTAIVETNNRNIDTKLYYGRFQIAKRYTSYYMKKVGLPYSWGRPSEYAMRKMVKVILKDSIEYLKKNKLPVTMYNARMVYMLGRGNYKKFINNRLSKSLIKSNIPRGKQLTHKELHNYWVNKVRETLKRC